MTEEQNQSQESTGYSQELEDTMQVLMAELMAARFNKDEDAEAATQQKISELRETTEWKEHGKGTRKKLGFDK